MPDQLETMRIFVETAELGSFASVARRRSISSQMVAKHIQALEERLGASLIHRTTRQQSLTDQGRAYLERCRAILADIEETESLVAYAGASPRGVLRVSAPVTFGAYAVLPIIADYLSRHREVRCEFDLSDDLVDPVGGGYDAVFRIGPVDGRRAVVAVPLRPYRLVACASPDYLARHGDPGSPAALAGHECIGFAYRDAGMRAEWRFAKGGRIVPVAIYARLVVSDWQAMHRAALSGLGIALAQEVAIAEDLATGRLRRVVPGYDVAVRPMNLLHPRRSWTTRRASAFIDLVRERLGQ